MFFLDFSVQIRPDTKIRPRRNILILISYDTILSAVTSFPVNYNKSQLKHEIKYLHKIWPKNKNLPVNLGLLSFFFTFFKPKNLGFFKAIFQPCFGHYTC